MNNNLLVTAMFNAGTPGVFNKAQPYIVMSILKQIKCRGYYVETYYIPVYSKHWYIFLVESFKRAWGCSSVRRVPACCAQGLDLTSSTSQTGHGGHSYNPRDSKGRGRWIQCYCWPQSEFKANLGYMRLFEPGTGIIASPFSWMPWRRTAVSVGWGDYGIMMISLQEVKFHIISK